MTTLLHIVFMKMIEISLASTVVALILLLLRKFARKLVSPRAIGFLWLILLLKLAFPFPPSSVSSIENWTDAYLYDQTFSVTGAIAAAADGMTEVKEKIGLNGTGGEERAAFSYAYKDGVLTHAETVIRDPEAIAMRRQGEGMDFVLTGLGGLWLGGIALYIALGVLRSRGERRLNRSAVQCRDSETLQLFQTCKRETGVKRNVMLMLSGSVYPALYGLLKPRILLPYDYKQTYSADELRFVLLHELAHVKRWDIVIYRMSGVFRTLYWLNPVIRLAMRKVRDDAEVGCDARVMRLLDKDEVVRYGMLLVRQAELNGVRMNRRGAGVLWFAGRSELGERIRHIAARASSGKSKKWTAVAGIAIFIMLFVVLVPGNNLYAERKAYLRDGPTMYAVWIDERVDPRSMKTIESMSRQMAGLQAEDGEVVLLLQEAAVEAPFQRGFGKLQLLLQDGKSDVPIAVETARIRQEADRRGLKSGTLFVMIKYDYTYTKYFSFGVGKQVTVDLASLRELDAINLY